MCPKGVKRIINEVKKGTSNSVDRSRLLAHLKEKREQGQSLTRREKRAEKQLAGDSGRKGDNTAWNGDKEIYSVIYEAELPSNMYPDVSDARHFQEANRQLNEAFKKDAEFANNMEKMYPGIVKGVQPGKRGAYPRKAPTADVTWHHEANRKGILQLMPIEQHTANGKIQSILHPDGKGGMQNWGGGRKRKK